MPTPHEHTHGAKSRDLSRAISAVQAYALIDLDPDGVIQSWNEGARLLKGYDAGEAIGRSFEMFYLPEALTAGVPKALLAEAEADGYTTSEGWRVRKDGSRFWADVTISAIRDDDGTLTGFFKITRDMTEQRALLDSLAASEERFRRLVDEVRDYAIIALDRDGTIKSWNAGAERMKGYSAEEAIGLNFAMFYPIDAAHRRLPLELLSAAAEHGSVEHTGWRVRKDGSQFWAAVSITAIHDVEGKVTGFSKVTRDLTESKQRDEAHATFLATIAHDFKTPLAALKGFAELIADMPPEHAVAFLPRIAANAERLAAMADDLQTYAADRSLTVKVAPEPLDLAALVRETVEALASSIDISRVETPQGRGDLISDRASLERVVTNLVSNAVKYSEDGPVRVSVEAEGAWVTLAVADQGRGIAADDLATIFDEFARGRLAHEDGGQGLGLSSVRQLVENLGGTVEIESTEGVGTTVSAHLPIN